MTSVFGPPPTAAPVVGEFQFAFARTWLFKQGIHAEPTWFIAMRLAGRGHARYQAFTARHPVASTLLAFVPMLPGFLATFGGRIPGAWLLLPFCLVPFAVSAWFNHEEAVGERRVATILPRRVARPVAPKWTDFVTGWHACALVLTYFGGFGMAAGLIVLGEVLAGSLLAGGMLLGVGVTTWQTRRVLNRPALAVDALTLLVDDRLRAEDVRGAVFPVAAIVFFLVPVSLTDLVAVQLTLFGLCVASFVCWGVGGRRAKATRKRRVGAP
ncbi:hypothetical protein [Amycolatopsis sp. YIM 10]|uniref:hypothetical protein n=1 Tax=Amycolatopsis sp. YIM 10 TaxID=2653857 RepID=UPI001290241E|nr:hypothetical protein [Amycolatopsis sp. YIM 10]QFU93649.1 hypothetical protein YIM_42570 [Amycolatopsis sp. YIM 10]